MGRDSETVAKEPPMTNTARIRIADQSPTEELRHEVLRIAAWLQGREISSRLSNVLEAAFPSGGEQFARIAELVPEALAQDGHRVDGSTTFLRLAEPGPASCGFSIDLVELEDVRGPRHVHPRGEVDLVVPMTEAGEFNGRGRGWLALRPGSAHRPTAIGKVAVIYFLPGGEMTF